MIIYIFYYINIIIDKLFCTDYVPRQVQKQTLAGGIVLVVLRLSQIPPRFGSKTLRGALLYKKALLY